VKITIPREVWNTLVEKRYISERGYPGFSGDLQSTELRFNSQEAVDINNQCRRRILKPNSGYDYRLHQ